MKQIKNIILDLGGVIINIDPPRTVEALRILGFPVDNQLLKVSANEQLALLETGRLSSKDLYKKLATDYGTDPGFEEFLKAWNELLLDIPAERIALLKKLNSEYRLFLLSNTNPIHIQAINRQLHETYSISHLSSLFEKIYLSYEIGMAKPDPRIFNYILKDNNILPEETLFIDDTAGHLEAARSLGIETALVDQEFTILQLFK